jgi:tetratricopeptide (TPR) repeat protein
MPAAGRLRARVGIATGVLVVTPDDKSIVGRAMNLAARLQALAEPGTIAVSATVRRIAGEAFRFEDIGEHELKGFARATRVFEVRGVVDAASRLEAARGTALTPLAGRGAELELMLARWRAVEAEHAGQVIVLSGEAGIGKSRLAEALRARLAPLGVQAMRFQCSPFHVSSAFHPLIAGLSAILGFAHGDTPEQRLDKLEAQVVHLYRLPLASARLIAAMLSLPQEARHGQLDLPPRIAKQETMRAAIDFLAASMRVQPSLLMFEDLHWADPSTLDALDALIRRLRELPVLAVFTSRPDFRCPWIDEPGVTALGLPRLTPDESASIVSSLAGGKELPPGLARSIVARADGVPLFVEEMLKAVIEAAELRLADDRWVSASGTVDASILPDTLRDTLMARLDRSEGAKRVAQLGAVMGREFAHDVLAEAGAMDEDDLAEALEALVSSGLVQRRGMPPDATYVFKHALVQDIAYDSLLAAQRRQWHARIARALEQLRPEFARSQPEVLAHHHERAGMGREALGFWQAAGDLALSRFALSEAISHLRRGLALVAGLPPSRERDATELALRTRLGPAIVARSGWGHADVATVLEPAWHLASALDARDAFVPVLHALWVHNLSIDRLGLSLEWAGRLLEAAARTGDEGMLIVGHRAASGSHYWLGNPGEARRHGDQVQALYDVARHGRIVQQTNTDPLTGEGIYRGQYLWMLGHPDQAVAASEAKDEHARRSGHPFDHAFALTLGAQVFAYRREPAELLRRTEEAERVGRTHAVPLLSEILAEISRGIAAVQSGDPAGGAARIDAAVTRLMATGHRVWVWYLRALQAEGLALAGDERAAAALLDQCVERIEAGEQRCHFPEVLRLRGWLRGRMGRRAEAEADLGAAIALARRQSARSWELRAIATLLRLRGPRDAEARGMLAQCLGWFTEGLDTPDLREARALLGGDGPAGG